MEGQDPRYAEEQEFREFIEGHGLFSIQSLVLEYGVMVKGGMPTTGILSASEKYDILLEIRDRKLAEYDQKLVKGSSAKSIVASTERYLASRRITSEPSVVDLTSMDIKYFIHKKEDVEKHLNTAEKHAYAMIQDSISSGRKLEGKKPHNTYVVINTDEPFINEIVEVLKKHGRWG